MGYMYSVEPAIPEQKPKVPDHFDVYSRGQFIGVIKLGATKQSYYFRSGTWTGTQNPYAMKADTLEFVLQQVKKANALL